MGPLDINTLLILIVAIATALIGWYTKLVDKRQGKLEDIVYNIPKEYVSKSDHDSQLERLENKIDEHHKEVMIELRLKQNKN